MLELNRAIFAILAHGGKPQTPHDLVRTWGLEPYVLVGLALTAWLYVRGASYCLLHNVGSFGGKFWARIRNFVTM